MINIDDRLLAKVDDKETFLLLHIAKRINKDRTCWPSNKTLCEDTGWHLETLQKVKKSLIAKKLLAINVRKTGAGQGSNIYQVTTSLIGVYTPMVDLDPLPDLSTPPGKYQDGAPLEMFDTSPGENSGNEVLTNEVLTNTSGVINFKDRPNVEHLIIDALNETKKAFGIKGESRWTKERATMIKARLKEWPGENPSAEIRAMFVHRCKVWKGTEWEKFIRVETLFQAKKFTGYMEAAEAEPAPDWTEQSVQTTSQNNGFTW